MKQIYTEIKNACGLQAEVVVVSKKRSLEEIMSYYEAGVRDFGENRADDLIKKAEALPKDIRIRLVQKLNRMREGTILTVLVDSQIPDDSRQKNYR